MQTVKLQLISWLAQLNDERMLGKVAALQREDSDFWHTLTKEEQQEILDAADELDAGHNYTYESVVSRFRR